MNKNYFITFIILTILNFSCKSYVISDNEEEFKEAYSTSKLTSVSIETKNIYKLYSYWIGSKKYELETRKHYSTMDDYRDIYGNGLKNDEFIRIQKNKKLNFYYKPKNKIIDCDFFDKSTADLIGIYDIHNEEIHTKRALWVGHSGKKIQGKIIIKEDTLYLMEKMGGFIKHHQYIKMNCISDK